MNRSHQLIAEPFSSSFFSACVRFIVRFIRTNLRFKFIHILFIVHLLCPSHGPHHSCPCAMCGWLTLSLCVMSATNCICFSLIIWNLLSLCSVTLFIVYWITSYVSLKRFIRWSRILRPPTHKFEHEKSTNSPNNSRKWVCFFFQSCIVLLCPIETMREPKTNESLGAFFHARAWFAQRSFGPDENNGQELKTFESLYFTSKHWCTHYSSWIDGFVRWTDEKYRQGFENEMNASWNILSHLFIFFCSRCRLFRLFQVTL